MGHTQLWLTLWRPLSDEAYIVIRNIRHLKPQRGGPDVRSGSGGTARTKYRLMIGFMFVNMNTAF